MTSDLTIWRYLDFDKFASLISTSRLYFPSPTKFEDPWEFYFPRNWSSAEYWAEYLPRVNQNIRPADSQLCARNLISQISNIYHSKDNFGVSCWHRSSRESESMWRLYCKSRNAVAIKSNIYKFLLSLNRVPKIYFGDVRYLNFELPFDSSSEPHWVYDLDPYTKNLRQINVHDQIAPFLMKRLDFAHENECRAILSGVNAEIPRRDIETDLSVLVDEVFISPFADTWFEEALTAMVKELTAIPIDRITRSTLYNPPQNDIPHERYRDASSLGSKVHSEAHSANRKYILFPSIAEFERWHDRVKERLMFPNFGYNGLTGGIAFTATITTGWTQPIYNKNDSSVLGLTSDSLIEESEQILTAEQAIALGFNVSFELPSE